MAPSWMLLDIEGTTTPISFVYDRLFPFARERIGDYLQEHQAELAAEIEELRALSGKSDPSEAALALMDADSKTTALKILQGRVWEEGYRQGLLKGEVFDDVAPAFQRWTAQGRRIAIYSSGSVQAQQLLFGHSRAGDLTPFIRRYFDTIVGPKRESSSYGKIASELGTDPGSILFATDVVAEAEAARAAGLDALVMFRPGNPQAATEGFRTAPDFGMI